jgi:hypothetical protein
MLKWYPFYFLGTLDYSCSKAPAPAPEKARKSNESIFDGNSKI